MLAIFDHVAAGLSLTRLHVIDPAYNGFQPIFTFISSKLPGVWCTAAAAAAAAAGI
jgi:hypothetical protein